MRYCIKHTPNDITSWNVHDKITGEVVLFDDTYQVASNVAHELNHGASGLSECSEIARRINRFKKRAESAQAKERN